MLGMTKKNRGDEQGRKRENPRTGLKAGPDIDSCKSGALRAFGLFRD
jgi:hypothetical protein